MRASNLDEAARQLLQGRLVAFPTETVYGLGADATNDQAVARIFAAKGRPRFNPLITHYASAAAAEEEVVFTAEAERLAERFWPGPLTLVLSRRPRSRISLLCSAGLDSLGVRVPNHPLTLALLERAERPLAGPSANPSGRISPTTATAVQEAFGREVSMVLDGGSCTVGLESTVVALSEGRPRLLRPGAVTRAELEAVVGPLAEAEAGLITSPGQLRSHYAPSLPLRLDAESIAPTEALLAFGTPVLPGAAETINLSEGANLIEAASRLFAALRSLDRPEFSGIAAMPVPKLGLGEAINDRLARAAAPRDPAPHDPADVDKKR